MPGIAAAPPESLAAHRSAVSGFLARMLGDSSLAEELTQETLLKAHAARAGFRAQASVRSWLIAIALNLARDHLRSRKRQVEMRETGAVAGAPAAADAEGAVLRAEMSNCIAEYLFRLSSPQREVVALHDMGGLTHKEIAAELGISEGNSRVLLHRGRTALKAKLTEGCILSFGEDAVPCERKPG